MSGFRLVPSSFGGGQTGYDTALVCLNGHVVNWHVEEQPQDNGPHCERCGKETISKCPHCNQSIRGALPRYHPLKNSPPPAFCIPCGKPFPWTEAKIEAAKGLAEITAGITTEEKTTLKMAIDDMVGDTPRTQIGVSNFRRIVGKAGKAAGESFKEILIGVLSDVTKRALFGG